MKLAHKYAGILASGVFVMISLATYFGSLDAVGLVESLFSAGDLEKLTQLDLGIDTSLSKPLKVFTLAIPSALLAGILGYFLGDILAHPKGHSGPKEPGPQQQRTYPLSRKPDVPEGPAMTGEETFLDDFESTPDTEEWETAEPS